MARVLWKLSSAIASHSYGPSIASKSGMVLPFREVSYHDDLATPVSSPAPLLVHNIQHTATLVIEVFTSFTLSVNFNPGKTEAVISFRGPSAKKEDRQLAKNNYIINIPHTVGGSHSSLRVVPTYKHVGTKAAFSKNGSGEIALRAAVLRTDLAKIRALVNNLHGLPLPKKLSYIKAYLFSKGCYHCSTWPSATVFAVKPFNNAIFCIYRQITGNQFNADRPRLSDNDLLFKYNLTAPLAIISSARLQLLGRIIYKKVHSLINILQLVDFTYSGWLAALKCDFMWLASSEIYSPFINYTFPQWLGLVEIDPKQFIKNVRKHAISNYANTFYTTLQSSPKNTGPCTHLCHYCDIYFASVQQHSLHMFKSHGIKNPIRLHFSGIHCPICLKMFHTRERVLNHLRYRSSICRLNLLRRDPVLTATEANELDASEAGANRKLQSSGKRRHTKCQPSTKRKKYVLFLFFFLWLFPLPSG